MTKMIRWMTGRRAALPSLAWAAAETGPAGADSCRIGAQSYSFRNFSFEDSINQLKALGLDCMEFCAVHFPADADDANFANVKSTLAKAGIALPAFGVEAYTGDEAANRAKFVFAQALGIPILAADPTPDAFASLDLLCDEFGIQIAIHNHGPEARYNKVEDTLKAVQDHSPRIGACVDTGHALRSAEQPHEVIERLGDRVISVHLKDWTIGGDEQILGEGGMDLDRVAGALKAIQFSGPLIIEYENSPDNPVPDMKKGLENWRQAVQGA